MTSVEKILKHCKLCNLNKIHLNVANCLDLEFFLEFGGSDALEQ